VVCTRVRVHVAQWWSRKREQQEAMLAYGSGPALYELILGPECRPALMKLPDCRCKVEDDQGLLLLVVFFVFEGCLCIVSLMYSFFP
jgi:hypothetical protein